MKVTWIQYAKDANRFRIPKLLGFHVQKLHDVEKMDAILQECIENGYETIILTDEMASFSEDIIKKYQEEKQIHIVII